MLKVEQGTDEYRALEKEKNEIEKELFSLELQHKQKFDEKEDYEA